MTTYRTISCFRGLAPCRFPEDWLKSFDQQKGFAFKNGEAFINFGPHGAFGVRVEHDGPRVIQHARRLSPEEVNSITWRRYCRPWEGAAAASLFGVSSKWINLHEVE